MYSYYIFLQILLSKYCLQAHLQKYHKVNAGNNISVLLVQNKNMAYSICCTVKGQLQPKHCGASSLLSK